jgi:hypothetical protein
VPPTTVINAVSTGEAFSVTECTFTAAFAVLKFDSVLFSMTRAVAYLVGPAITVNSEPANEVTTPAPLAARVMAGPPTEVTMLSATPLMATEDMCKGFGWHGTTHMSQSQKQGRRSCGMPTKSRLCTMMSSLTVNELTTYHPRDLPEGRPRRHLIHQSTKKQLPNGIKCQGTKIKITYQRRLLQYNKNLPRLSTSLWRCQGQLRAQS